MRKKNNSGIVVALITAIFAVVAIFCLMAPGFDEASWGTGFIVSFGAQSKATVAVPALIIAFVLEIVAAVFALLFVAIRNKARTIVILFAGVCTLVAGILFLLSKTFFLSANGFTSYTDFKVGAGFITTAVFDFLATLTSLLVVYMVRRKDED